MSLSRTAAEVSILRLTDLPDKGDVSDWIAKGNTSEDLYALVSGADTVEPELTSAETPTTASSGKNTDDRSSIGKTAVAVGGGDHRPTKAKRKNAKDHTPETQSSRLMKLAQNVELFHTPDSEAFATVSVNSHNETLSLRSRDFRDWLGFQHWKAENSMPSTQAVQDAINGLSGQARFEGGTKGVHLRVAEFEGALYLDLGNQYWEAVKATADGWSVTDNPPVKFRRTKGMLPLRRRNTAAIFPN